MPKYTNVVEFNKKLGRFLFKYIDEMWKKKYDYFFKPGFLW